MREKVVVAQSGELVTSTVSGVETVIRGPQLLTSRVCGFFVVPGAVWWGQYGSLKLLPCTPVSPPHSLTHARTHSHSTTLHPLSLLHPRPTGNRRLSYCVFCKTWLNLINAVDFKQNHIWAEERGREIAERGRRVGEREEREQQEMEADRPGQITERIYLLQGLKIFHLFLRSGF